MSETADRRRGVWVAYHDDWSGAAVFASEVACLRHAVEHSMSASFVEFGIELREAVKTPPGQTRLRPKRKPKTGDAPAGGGDAFARMEPAPDDSQPTEPAESGGPR